MRKCFSRENSRNVKTLKLKVYEENKPERKFSFLINYYLESNHIFRENLLKIQISIPFNILSLLFSFHNNSLLKITDWLEFKVQTRAIDSGRATSNPVSHQAERAAGAGRKTTGWKISRKGWADKAEIFVSWPKELQVSFTFNIPKLSTFQVEQIESAVIFPSLIWIYLHQVYVEQHLELRSFWTWRISRFAMTAVNPSAHIVVLRFQIQARRESEEFTMFFNIWVLRLFSFFTPTPFCFILEVSGCVMFVPKFVIFIKKLEPGFIKVCRNST